MFGYATDETPDLMPAPIYYAHRLVQRQSEVRKDGRLPWLRPDAKSQVSVEYVDGKPTRIGFKIGSDGRKVRIAGPPPPAGQLIDGGDCNFEIIAHRGMRFGHQSAHRP